MTWGHGDEARVERPRRAARVRRAARPRPRAVETLDELRASRGDAYEPAPGLFTEGAR